MALSKHLSFFLLAALCASSNADSGPFNYKDSGLDWPGACADGKKQSPVNIVMDEAVMATEKERFHVAYGKSKRVAVVNKGTTVQLVPDAREEHLLHLSSGTYKLLQVHPHAFSEHAVNGLFAPLEVQFVHVHVDDPTKLAVVGVFMRLHRANKNSSWADQWLSYVPAVKGENVTVSVGWTLINTTMGFWAYSGSLTTPTCDEIVAWHVLRKAKFLSVAQSIDFMNLLSASTGARTDNRPPQPLNGRKVTFYHPAE